MIRAYQHYGFPLLLNDSKGPLRKGPVCAQKYDRVYLEPLPNTVKRSWLHLFWLRPDWVVGSPDPFLGRARSRWWRQRGGHATGDEEAQPASTIRLRIRLLEEALTMRSRARLLHGLGHANRRVRVSFREGWTRGMWPRISWMSWLKNLGLEHSTRSGRQRAVGGSVEDGCHFVTCEFAFGRGKNHTRKCHYPQRLRNHQGNFVWFPYSRI